MMYIKIICKGGYYIKMPWNHIRPFFGYVMEFIVTSKILNLYYMVKFIHVWQFYSVISGTLSAHYAD
jgi:hypothetical protein